MSSRRALQLASLCCAFLLGFAAPAEAQEATRARLLTQLDAATFNEHFPVIALAQGIDGRVVLSCNVGADGASVCSAVEDTPVNVGFGAAAVAMSRGWTFAPRLENGQQVASTLRVNIAFENEFSTRQAQQMTLYVDERRGAAEVSTETAIGAEHRQYLACAWAGGLCRLPDSDTPGAYQNTRYYPPAARAASIEGRALVACAVRASARIDCALEGEAPAGSEFGAHAVRLVTDTAAGLGLPQGAVFRVPVEFALHRNAQAERESMWDDMPTGNDYVRHYPPAALERGLSGAAMVVCEIQADRRLACELFGEVPENFGFGRAVLSIMSQFRVSEERFGTPGYTAGERLRRTIVFRLGR